MSWDQDDDWKQVKGKTARVVSESGTVCERGF